MLRHYQLEARDRVFKEWETVRSTLVVMPTGTGKTILKAGIIAQALPKRALVMAHREELIWQAQDKIQRFAGVRVGVEMADYYVNTSGLFEPPQVVACSVQTMNASFGDRHRMGRFKPTDFDLLICDECHHGTAKSYQRVFDYFKQNPNLKILGVTATPDRADEEALGKIFDSVAVDYEIQDAIKDGWLVEPYQEFVDIKTIDLSGCHTVAGDLNQAELAAVMESEHNLQGVAGATMEKAGNKRTILFVASVKQAEMLSNILNRHKPDCSNWVCGATNKEKRAEMLRDFRDNKFQFMCNCGVLTEGYDDWGVECIGMARPTKSRSLYAQMAGRGLRPEDGLVDPIPDAEARQDAIAHSRKPSCVILDFVGNSGRHKLVTMADVLGGKQSPEVAETAIKIAKARGGPVSVTDAMLEAEEELRQKAEAKRLAEEAQKARLRARVVFHSKRVNPFDVWDLRAPIERGWDKGKQLSLGEKRLLQKQGFDADRMTYPEGKALIKELFRRWNANLCTINQANVLKRYGYDTKDMSMESARSILDKLKANGWKRVDTPKGPPGIPDWLEESPFRE